MSDRHDYIRERSYLFDGDEPPESETTMANVKTATRIFINGRGCSVPHRFATYEEIVAGAALGNLPAEVVVTVTYRNGPRENVKGMLAPHEAVSVARAMAFTATVTTRS